MSMTREEMQAMMASMKAQQDALVQMMQQQAADKPTPTDKAEKPKTKRRCVAAPAARALAKELGVDIASLEGNGTGKNGCVTKDDVLRAAGHEPVRPSKPAKAAKPAVCDAVPPVVGDDAPPAKAPAKKAKKAKKPVASEDFEGHKSEVTADKFEGTKRQYCYLTCDEIPDSRLYIDAKWARVLMNIMRGENVREFMNFVEG